MKIYRKKLSAGVPAVAMADIAFNLLIFFIILAKTQDDTWLKWDAASTPRTQSVGTSKVSVTVDKNDHLYLNGNRIGVMALTADIEAILGDNPPGKRTVLLKIHKDSTAQTFEPIIEAVSRAGGEIVHILERKEDN